MRSENILLLFELGVSLLVLRDCVLFSEVATPSSSLTTRVSYLLDSRIALEVLRGTFVMCARDRT